MTLKTRPPRSEKKCLRKNELACPVSAASKVSQAAACASAKIRRSSVYIPFLSFSSFLSFLLVTSLVTLEFVVSSGAALFAKEQWEMQHPSGPAPSGIIDPGSMVNSIYDPTPPSNSKSGASSFAPGLVAPINVPGMGQNQASQSASVPGLALPGQGGALGLPSGGAASARANMAVPDVLKQILSTRIAAGTVLTGILADDLSSSKSLPQDLFSIVLPDGYFANGVEVIPPNSRIVGTVVSVAPARTLRGVSTPGNLQVGLTTLVFPDGRSCKFAGYIDRNPAHDLAQPPQLRSSSMNFSDYKRDLSSFMNSVTAGIGIRPTFRYRGPEFNLKAGTMVPVRLNSTVDVSRMTAPTIVNSAAASSSGGSSGSPSGTAGATAGNSEPRNSNYGIAKDAAIVGGPGFNGMPIIQAPIPPGQVGSNNNLNNVPNNGLLPAVVPLELPDPF